MFEAPTKDLQVEMIRAVGPAVNLGNVAASDVIGVETLRWGLRGDTLVDLTTGVAGSPLRSRRPVQPARPGPGGGPHPVRRLTGIPAALPSAAPQTPHPLRGTRSCATPTTPATSRSPLVIWTRPWTSTVRAGRQTGPLLRRPDHGGLLRRPARLPSVPRRARRAGGLPPPFFRAGGLPRHFGVSFAKAEDFDRPIRLAENHKLRVLSGPELCFEGTTEQHRTIFLADPSNDVLEFKNYDDPRLQY